MTLGSGTLTIFLVLSPINVKELVAFSLLALLSVISWAVSRQRKKNQIEGLAEEVAVTPWTRHRDKRHVTCKLDMVPPRAQSQSLGPVDAEGERWSGKALGHLAVSALNCCPRLCVRKASGSGIWWPEFPFSSAKNLIQEEEMQGSQCTTRWRYSRRTHKLPA